MRVVVVPTTLPQALGFSQKGKTGKDQGLPESPPPPIVPTSPRCQVEGALSDCMRSGKASKDTGALGQGSCQAHSVACRATSMASSQAHQSHVNMEGAQALPPKSVPSSLSQDTGRQEPRTRVTGALV